MVVTGGGTSPGEAVGWAIVGCGWVVRDYVAPAFDAAENASVVAVADPSEAALNTVSQTLPDAKRHRDPRSALLEAGVEAVYVATPNHLHREAVLLAAGAGKHVLCEKPVAPTLREAEEMVIVCKEAGVTYATAFDQRFHAAHLRLKELISSGRLGRVCSVRVRYACWLPPRWSPDEISEDNWRTDPLRAGGGAFVDLAPHGIDLVQHLLGEDLVETKTLFQRRIFDYAVEDGASLIGRFASGALFTQHVAYNTPETFPRRELEIVGTEAMALATDTMGQTPGGTLEIISAETGRREEVEVPGIERSPFLNQISAFSAALLSGEPFEHGPGRDLKTMEIVTGAIEENALDDRTKTQ
ncbi:Gfo/Idh/MocA family protein [Rubrobacter indicoceani]|uniref:Gfo/Idh/MocA family protein n=1 Tax=Rubrobacter indicoceani TaxID=2051957 RepID=UPI000E5BA60B|nr:Gfo/Idh/MocA family oxidoreductase [Rubrobacter indicoceani]